MEQVEELAGGGIEHLVLEFLSADGRDLAQQMAIFAERVRPAMA